MTCEVTPHHFALNDESVGNYDTQRQDESAAAFEEADREAMIAGLLDGSIDCIATDHAPHASHEKDSEFERAAIGITGLETALASRLRFCTHHFNCRCGALSNYSRILRRSST